MQYIGFGRRFVAALLDGLILGAVSFLLSMIFGGGSSYTAGSGMSASNNPVQSVLQIIISIGYWVVYQSYAGQTLGKKVMGIKVVDASGKKPTMVTFFLREVIGKFVSGIILGIGFLMILWDGKKQGLHDKIASTFVVKA